MVAKSFDKVDDLRDYEIRKFTNPREDLSVRIDKFANYMGRKWGIGRIAGAVRFVTGAIFAALCAVSAIFLLLAAGVTYPIHDQAFNYTFAYSIIFAFHTVEAILQSGRGFVETIPVVGSLYFINTDYYIYSTNGMRGMASRGKGSPSLRLRY